MTNMNNNASSSSSSNSNTKKTVIIRRSVSEAKAAQTARDNQREIDEVKADLKDRKIQEGEALRRILLQDSRDNGARRGAGDFYSGLGGFDTSLIVRR